MKIVLDASSSINLHRGGALETVFDLISCAFMFHIGYIVRAECADLQGVLDEEAKKGRLILLPDETLSPDEFAHILDLYDLGLGETECIALAQQRGFSVCTDDKAARRAAIECLGENRVLGSIRLLRECVCRRSMTPQGALIAYQGMKACGAFLPAIPTNYFDC